MSRNIKIALVILAILLIGALGFWLVVRQTTPTTTPSTEPSGEQPTTTNFALPATTDDKMFLPLENGSLEVNNIYKDPIASLEENGVDFAQSPDYAIAFYPDNQGFIITITNPEIQAARDSAEIAFLMELGITQEEACKLNVSLSVPFSINQQNAGQEFGLSFCPNGKAFN